MRRLLAGVLLGALALTGCSDDKEGEAAAGPSPSPSGPSAGANCPDMAAKGKPVRFGVDGGAYLAGLVGGTGSTGVVLAHQNGGDVCQWEQTFAELTDKGYRVLAFDAQYFGASLGKDGTTPDSDVVAAAAALRAEGASKIALIGASMGGTTSLSAASKIDPPVAAVVSLSAPASFNGVNADAAKLKVPAYFAAQTEDAPFGDDAKAMHQAAKASPDAQLKVTVGATHGYQLLATTDGDQQIRKGVLDFLAKHAPAA